MLVCYRTRRRIGAYLDGALGTRAALATAAHLRRCARCHADADALRRLHITLRAALDPPSVVEWSGFWAGIVDRIEHGEPPRPVRARRSPAWDAFSWHRPRLAIGGALAAAAIAGVTVWGTWTDSPESAVTVSAASSEHPAATVMVYAPPERDLAVVWVFDLE